MCGIVGWLTREKSSDATERRKFIEQALILDTVRGYDSAGVFTVDHAPTKEFPVNWLKNVGGGMELVVSKEFSKAINNSNVNKMKYCVGHNRAATVGGISTNTAHPFVEGPITLVHNGTVNKDSKLVQDEKAKGAYNDSHAICKALSYTSVPDVIKSLDGAFALVWHDQRDDSLNFVRNDKRPMHFAKAKKEDTIYFSSEGELLHWLDTRLSLQLQDIVSLKPLNWLKFLPGKKMFEPEVLIMEPYKFSGKKVNDDNWRVLPQKSTTVQTSSRIGSGGLGKSGLLGLKGQPHPQLLVDLKEMGINHEQVYPFISCEKDVTLWRKSNPEITAYGWIIDGKNHKVYRSLIYGMTPNTYENTIDKIVSVRPVAVKMVGYNDKCVVSRFVGLSAPNGTKIKLLMPTNRAEQYKNTNSIPEPKDLFKYLEYTHSLSNPFGTDTSYIKDSDLDMTEDDVPYPGPGNLSLGESEWLTKTKNGCYCCRRSLLFKDAWGLEWVNKDKDPLCPECLAKYTSVEDHVDLDVWMAGEIEHYSKMTREGANDE